MFGVVGIGVGVLMSCGRLHLGLPGHRALLWMVPIVVARLLTRCPVGGTGGTLAAALTSLALGGRFAGGFIQLPMVVFAGAVLDLAAGLAERRRLSARWAIPLLGVGGAAANLLCFFKRLAAPAGPGMHRVLGASHVWTDLGLYAIFGLTAGLLGAAAAYLLKRR
jgi:hypothetical protein